MPKKNKKSEAKTASRTYEAEKQARYFRRLVESGKVRLQIWVTPEEKNLLLKELENTRNPKCLDNKSLKPNELNKEIFAGFYSSSNKLTTEYQREKYYSNAFFCVDSEPYGRIRPNIPKKLEDAYIVFQLSKTKSYPIIHLKGLGDPTVICAILFCLHSWYSDSQHEYDRRRKVLNLKLHNVGEDIKRMVYKARALVNSDLTGTAFEFFTQPLSVEYGTISREDFDSFDTDQFLITVDDGFKVVSSSDDQFTLEDILRWPESVFAPIIASDTNTLNDRYNLMKSLIALFSAGSDGEVPCLYINKVKEKPLAY